MTTETFTTGMYEEAVEIINRMCRCPDRAAVALALTWFRWSKRPDVTINHHAFYSCLQVWKGRDLPGVQKGWKRDALSHSLSGAGMDEVLDRRPGPLEQMVAAESEELLMELATDRELILIDLFASGKKNNDVAAELGVSAGRVTQMRQRLMEKLREQQDGE
jgi:DNA-directed RNA polymerase specialized sigma24 family protein